MARILRLGLPVATQDFLSMASFLIILSLVNALGLTASAGVGVAEKLCGFLMLVPSAYMQSMSAFTAQNMGAKEPARARTALRYAILSVFAVGLALGFVSFFHSDALCALFARNEDVIVAGADYLRAYAIDCVLTPVKFCMIGFFNGCGQTTFVMLEGLAGAFGVRVPVSWYMSTKRPVSLFGIGLAIPASSVLEILLCIIWYVRLMRRQHANERTAA